MKGQPRPIEYLGLRYPSHTAFSRAFGLDPRSVHDRLDRYHITGERLIRRYAVPRRTPLPAKTPTSPMYVWTRFGEWKV